MIPPYDNGEYLTPDGGNDLFFSTIYPAIEGIAKFHILHEYFFNSISSAERRLIELKVKLLGSTDLKNKKIRSNLVSFS